MQKLEHVLDFFIFFGRIPPGVKINFMREDTASVVWRRFGRCGDNSRDTLASVGQKYFLTFESGFDELRQIALSLSDTGFHVSIVAT